jgi:hypothetical protein
MTVGLSPKMIAATLTALVAAILNRFALELPREVEVIIQAASVAIAAYLAGPGEVLEEVGPASDSLLDNVDGESVSGPQPPAA